MRESPEMGPLFLKTSAFFLIYPDFAEKTPQFSTISGQKKRKTC